MIAQESDHGILSMNRAIVRGTKPPVLRMRQNLMMAEVPWYLSRR